MILFSELGHGLRVCDTQAINQSPYRHVRHASAKLAEPYSLCVTGMPIKLMTFESFMNKHNSSKLPLYAVLIGIGLLAAGCNRDDKQAKQPAQTENSVSQPEKEQSPKPGKQLSSLESLVAPIALYPDPLLAELLVASTYPLEVVQAARWVDSKPDLNTLKDKNWDASVMRMVDVPQVLKLMSDHLDWTTQLGNTFLAQPDEVMNAIQALRRRAKQNGFLKDTPEQKVSSKMEDVRQSPVPAAASSGDMTAQPAVYKQEVVYIEPAKSNTLYVPQYQPESAYSASLAPQPGQTAAYAANPSATSYYPTTAPATATSSGTDWMTFGLGAVAGGLLTWGIMEWSHNNSWNSYYGGRYYPPVSHYYGGAVCRYGNCWNGGNVGRNNVNYNKNINVSGNDVNVGNNRTFSQDKLASIKNERQGWTHDVRHREGVKYPDGIKDKIGQINRPGSPGTRPGAPQTLPANIRGLDGAGGRPSADQVRDSLSKGSRLGESGLKDKAANRPNLTRPDSGDVRQRLGGEGQRPNLPEGLRDSGAKAKAGQMNLGDNRQKLQDKARVGDRANLSAGRDRLQQAAPKAQQRREMPQQQRAQRQQPAAKPNLSQGGGQNLANRQKPASRPQPAGGGLGQRSGGAGAKLPSGGFGRSGMPNRASGGGGFGGGGRLNR